MRYIYHFLTSVKASTLRTYILNGTANESRKGCTHLHASHAPSILVVIAAEKELFTGMRALLKGDKPQRSVFAFEVGRERDTDESGVRSVPRERS